MDKEKLIELRNKGLSFPKIAREIGSSRELVRYHMNKMGYNKSVPNDNPFANSKYTYDITYFDKIDTQEKAYILGLLYADGNNYSKDKKKVSITLHKNDSYLLEKINELLKSIRPLQTSGNASVLHLSGKLISDQLIKLGCVPRKSLILKFPSEKKVPQHLVNHFIRGYFDGDGCVHRKKGRNDLYITLIGTLDFLSEISIYLEKYNITSRIKKVNTNIYRLDIYRILSVANFQRLIYKNSTIHLERKFNKFL